MTDIRASMGNRIRQQREFLGMTREQLSDKSDISVQFIADIERGRKGCSVDTLKKLCEALVMSADKIVWGKVNKSDVQALTELLENVDEKYIPILVEHVKLFIKAISMNE